MVELTMTVLLIGILAAIVTPKLLQPRTTGKNTEAKVAVTNAFSVAKGFFADNRSFEGLCVNESGPSCNNKVSLHSLSNQVPEVELADDATPADAKGAPRGAVWMGDGLSSTDPAGTRKNYIVLCSLRQDGDTVYCIKDAKGVLSYAKVQDEDVTVASVGNDPDLFSTEQDLDGKQIAQASAGGEEIGVETDSPPVNDTPPSFTGVARVGESLLGTPGSWAGRPTPTYTYQWQRCDNLGQNCVNISGAIASAYTLTSEEQGKTVRLQVDASNLAGDATAFSNASDPVSPAGDSNKAPLNASEPSISGSAKLGSTLTADPGTWDGRPTPTFTYQWRRCELSGSSCTNIDSATGETYQLKEADVAKTIRVRVVATNSEGSANATSPPRGPVASPPANLAKPSLTGTIEEGRTLGVDEGSWSGYPYPSFTYQWRRCDSDGANCQNIDGQTESTYVIRFADRGNTLRVSVTGTNAAGSDTAVSDASQGVPGGPVSLSPPTVSGDPKLGETLTATKGSWSGFPTPTYTYQWQRCSRVSDSCTDIDSETGSTYQVIRADGGSRLRVSVRASNPSGNVTEPSLRTDPARTPPVSVNRPTLSGSANVDQTLSTSNGTWDAYPEPDYTYKWVRCEYLATNSCNDIANQTGASYTVGDSDTGMTLNSVVTATNSEGSASAESVRSNQVINPPVNLVLPSISGTLRVGSILSGSPGSWRGNPAFTFSWFRCDPSGGGCLPIDGADSQTYTLVDDDTGNYVKLRVLAKNSSGEAIEFSDQVGRIKREPKNTAAPSISGTAAVGQSLTASPGDWLAYPTPAFTYQWQRCDTAGENCTDIDSAAGRQQSYSLTMDEVGLRIRVKVKASNELGFSEVPSSASSRVSSKPVNTVRPTISGDNVENQTLTANPGTWQGYPSISFNYRWQRCDSNGDSCDYIANAVGQSYTQSQADSGFRIRVEVTASNTAGETIAYSDANPQTEVRPWNTSPPTISGTASVDSSGGEVSVADEGASTDAVLTGDPGSWGGYPTPTTLLQWQVCSSTDTTTCTDISGSTGSSFAPTSLQRGKYIRLKVTASNRVGSREAFSSLTDRVTMRPVVDSLPVITGSVIRGGSLTSSSGSWLAYPDPTYKYQYQRCAADGTGCTDILSPDLTNPVYLPVALDVTKRLKVIVTATNSQGSSSASSALTDVVTDPPVNLTAPSVLGVARVDETLTSTPGTWSGYPTPALTYQWVRCNSLGQSCGDISGATQSSRVLVSADAGMRLKLRVTATNVAGSASMESSLTDIVLAEPINVTRPALSGSALEGSTLSVSNGTWVNNPTSYAYKWQRCTNAGVGCVDIANQSGSSYTLTSSDVQSTIQAIVTATNQYGSTPATSDLSAQVRSAPVNTVAPVISGTFRIFQTLSVSSGTWTGFPTPSLAYEWQVSDDGSTGWTAVPSATGQSYIVASGYSGKYLRVKVTGTNSVTSTVAYAAPQLIVGVPIPNVAPTISGTAQVGSSLSVSSNGTWYGNTPITYTYQWQRSSASASNSPLWSDITGANSSSYPLVAADTQMYVRLKVTATNNAGSDINYSTASSQVRRAPQVTIPPSVSGSELVGGILTTSPGTWAGFPTPVVTRNWQRCDINALNCVDITGATGLTYTSVLADAGSRLVVTESASNVVGSATSTSSATGVIKSVLSNTALPVISGNAWTGQTLTASSGSWTGYPAPSFSYRWQQSNDGVTGWANLPAASASSSNYSIPDYMGGIYARVAVTATNELGSVVAYSDPTSMIATLPTNTLTPSFSGTGRVGQTLTGSPGTWSGFPTPTTAYQWQRCNAAQTTCSDISGATSQTYIIQAADASNVVRLSVIGSTPKGSATAYSSATDPIPSAAGCSEGASGEYRVHSCYVPSGQDYQMPSASSQTITLYRSLNSDVLLVGGGGAGGRERGGGGGGGGVVTSNLTLSSGTYSVIVGTGGGLNTTTCNGGLDFAGSSSRLVSPGGSTLFTANGGGGGGSYTPTAPVGCSSDSNAGGSGGSGGGAGINFSASVFSGGAATAGQGNTGGGSKTVASDSNRCSGGGGGAGGAGVGNCSTPDGGAGRSSAISGVTTNYGGGGGGAAGRLSSESSITTTSAGAGGSGGGGAGAAVGGGTGSAGLNGLGGGGGGSNSSALPAKGGSGVVVIRYKDPMKPSNSSLPTISGVTAVGQTLTADPGSWVGFPAPTYTYQWQYSTTGVSGWLDVSGATSTTLALASGDAGRYFRVLVTATNEAGTFNVSSASTGQVGFLPENSVAPSITGATVVGSVLSGTSGTWSGSPTPTYTYQWQRSSDGSTGWSDITSATASTYTLASADGDKFLRLQVTATNSLGAVSKVSNVSAKVTQPPSCSNPTVSGTYTVGQTLTSSAGSCSGFPAPSVTYQWQSSADGSTGWTDISGATSSTYTLVSGDAGRYVRVQVIGTNSSGSASGFSTSSVVNQPPGAGTCPVTGNSSVGSILTVTCSGWTGFPAPTFTYQWQYSNDGTTGWLPLTGAINSTYALTSAVGGRYVRVVVTGTNSLGSATLTSGASYVSQPPQPPPGFPVVSGTFQVGQTLTGDPGTWGGSPAPVLTYQWQWSTDGINNWQPISGATNLTYALTSTEASRYVRFAVTGTNASGATTVYSSATQVTQAPVPGTCSLSGTLTQGQTLSVSCTAWGGFPAPVLTYQWQKSLDGATNWTNLTGANLSSYTTTSAEVGFFMRAVVTGTNSVGSGVANATSSNFVASPPLNTVLPTISGTTFLGQTMTGTNGTWTGNPTPTLTYQWQICTSTTDASCSNITVNGTSSSFTITSTVTTALGTVTTTGNRLRLGVSGTNRAAGPIWAYSTISALIDTQAPTLAWNPNPATPQLTGQTTIATSWTLGGGTPTSVQCATQTTATNPTSTNPAPTWSPATLSWSNCASNTSNTFTLGNACEWTRVWVRASNPGGSPTISSDIKRNCAAPSFTFNSVPPDFYWTSGSYTYSTTNATSCSYEVWVDWSYVENSGSCSVGSNQLLTLTRPQGNRNVKIIVTNSDGTATANASDNWFSGPSVVPNGNFEAGSALGPHWAWSCDGCYDGGSLSFQIFDGSWRAYAETYYNDQWRGFDGGSHFNRCDGIRWDSRPTMYTYVVAEPRTGYIYGGGSYTYYENVTYSVQDGVLRMRIYDWNPAGGNPAGTGQWVLVDDASGYQNQTIDRWLYSDTYWENFRLPGQARNGSNTPINTYCGQSRRVIISARSTGGWYNNGYVGYGGGWFDNIQGTNDAP